MPFDIIEMPEDGLVTVANIPIAAVGEDWLTSTGKATITADDLVAAVAALDDPAIKTPRIKLGHLDPRFTPDLDATNPFDGTPTLGKFDNLRLGDNGMTLYADAMGIPKWFATIMPYAYPNRSIEGFWGVKTATGKTHDFVITAVALLGDELPAIETLDDLQTLFTAEGPDYVQQLEGQKVAASRGGNVPRDRRIAASTSVEDVRRSFLEDFATEESGRYWWWVRAVYMDPHIVICTDDSDTLYAVPYTPVDGGAEFGDPVDVFTQYVETETGKVAASRVMAQPAVAVFTKSGGSRPETKKEVKMARVIHASVDVPALRSRLGLTAEQLPDDATDEQINSALTTVTAGTSPDPAQTPATTDTSEPGTPEAGSPAPGEAPEGGGNPSPGTDMSSVSASGGVVVDPAALAELQRNAALGVEARNEQVAARRAAKVKAAIDKGKVPPVRRDHYMTLMSKDEEGTTTFLESLQEGVVPVSEVGSGNDSDSEALSGSEYPPEWLTDGERARIAAARAGQPANSRVVQEAK